MIPEHQKYVEIIFKDDETRNVRVQAETIRAIIVKDGFLKIYDSIDCDWHCYNIDTIRDFHYPDWLFDRRTGHRRNVNY